MKTIFLMPFIILMLLNNFLFGQIKTTKAISNKDVASKVTYHYDSTKNFLGKNVFAYIGQDLYLKGMPIKDRKIGYKGFIKNYTLSDDSYRFNVYKCCSQERNSNNSRNSNYDSLVGKYFTVLDVVKYVENADNILLGKQQYILKLIEKESKDTLFYKYIDGEYVYTTFPNDEYVYNSFPFVVVGFYEKCKKLWLGKEFIFANKGEQNDTKINLEEKWKCIDISVEEENYTLIFTLQNKEGRTITRDFETVVGRYKDGETYTLREVEKYKKKVWY